MNTSTFRALTADEVHQLQLLGNHSNDWGMIQVVHNFNPTLYRGNIFAGHVTLGFSDSGELVNGDLVLPEGIYNSVIRDSHIGDHCAVHNVRMLSGYTIGSHTIMFNIDEMTAGNPSNAAWLEPMNENGGRRILPYAGMTIADAYLWAKYRDHANLISRLEEFTRHQLNTPNGSYSQVGSCSVIKNCKTIHNVAILSDEKAPTIIESCTALTDGVVGYGCHCQYGIMATRFLLGENVHLEMGARVNDTVVGDNSTIARCEVGNSLIFPAHEQHHNNSFLIAANIMGQSNIAAGCTLGSNHNGRTADNELVAGRGFWPGLCSSIKHSSAFASYTLLAKADYPAELSITLPFSLVNNNAGRNQLEVMPAYWWMYNMYALNRNITKFAKRDHRYHRSQNIVFSPFAPDTAEEIVNARMLLRYWIEQAYLASSPSNGNDKKSKNIEVLGFGLEKGKRKTVILKWAEGYRAYEEMLIYYAMNELAADNLSATLPDFSLAQGQRQREWANLGGQLVPQPELDTLISDIEHGRINSWDEIHDRYAQWWQQYPLWCRQHAYHVLCFLSDTTQLDVNLWNQYLQRYATIRQYVADQIRITRQKDNANPYRQMTYRNDAEMQSVLE